MVIVSVIAALSIIGSVLLFKDTIYDNAWLYITCSWILVLAFLEVFAKKKTGTLYCDMPEKKKLSKETPPIGGSWIVTGILFGILFGTVFDNIGVGIALGVTFGVALEGVRKRNK